MFNVNKKGIKYYKVLNKKKIQIVDNKRVEMQKKKICNKTTFKCQT